MSGEAYAVQEAGTVYAAEVAETDQVLPGFKQTEMGVIPEDWLAVPISEIVQNVIDYRGRTPRKLGMTWGGGNIPALSARNVKMGFIDFEEETHFGTEALYKRWMTNGDPKRDDIVVTTEAPLGNVALIPDDQKYILSQRTILLQTNQDRVINRYLVQLMRSKSFQRLLSENATGSTATGIQRRKFEVLEVPLPQIPEQSAIASALSDVDALISSLDRLISKKRAVKTAAMQELLTGKQRLPSFSGEWKARQFADIASPRRERVDPRKVGSRQFCVELEYIESGTGRLLGSTSTKDQSSLKSVFQVGDVLFGKLRSYLRKYWLADRSGVCSTEIWVLSPNHRLVTSEFLFQIVRMDRFIGAASTAYGTHMPRADWNVVKNYELAVPGLEEQTAVAAVLSDMDAEIEALEARRKKTRQVKQGMMQDLLTGRTRLVPEGA